MKYLILLLIYIVIAGCSNEKWTCVTKGKTMYSMSDSGKLGGANKGCTCNEIRSFEMRVFGEIDETALKSDFGC